MNPRAHEAPVEGEPPVESGLENLGSRELEQILIELLVVRYPGIEQSDIDCLFAALDAGAIDLVERIEADIAEKSARWRLAARNLGK